MKHRLERIGERMRQFIFVKFWLMAFFCFAFLLYRWMRIIRLSYDLCRSLLCVHVCVVLAAACTFWHRVCRWNGFEQLKMKIYYRAHAFIPWATASCAMAKATATVAMGHQAHAGHNICSVPIDLDSMAHAKNVQPHGINPPPSSSSFLSACRKIANNKIRHTQRNNSNSETRKFALCKQRKKNCTSRTYYTAKTTRNWLFQTDRKNLVTTWRRWIAIVTPMNYCTTEEFNVTPSQFHFRLSSHDAAVNGDDDVLEFFSNSLFHFCYA